MTYFYLITLKLMRKIAPSVAVIDMTPDASRVVDQVAAGDLPEGLAVSPTGGYAVSLLTNGSGNSAPNNVFYASDHSTAVLLRINNKTVRKVGETLVGGLAERIAFSPDGRYVYIANGVEQSLVTFRVAGDKLVPTGSHLKLPGHPASMRGDTP